jgi:pimeloyl-ACP methyl ester carboxylesterase
MISLARRTAPSVVLLSALLSACADRPGPTAPDRVSSAVTTVSSSALWEKEVVGTTGPGSSYALYLPHDWNGEVVYWSHGIRVPSEPVALPTNEGIEGFRDALGALHYAVAYSSYDENGYALEDGVQRTHQLRGLVTSQFGRPTRSYLAGASMGGLVSLALAERFPQQYDGVLTTCGQVGGTRAQIQYVADVRALFDFFYSGVLPGDAMHVPANLDVNTQVLGPALAAMSANPTGAFAMARVTQTPLAVFGATPQQQAATLFQSILTALGYNAVGTNDVLDRTHGHFPIDNMTTVYTGALPATTLAAINAGIDRFSATPDALRYVDHTYEPTGELEIPMVSLHNLYDPTVPFFNETLLAAAVGSAGRSDLLLQKAFARYGHCTFSTTEMMSGFQALAQWVASGQEPTL